jgi:hypothetical protein
MKRRPKARVSSSGDYPFLKTGKNRCRYPHNMNIRYSKVGGLRRKASDVGRWLVNRKQVASTASRWFGLLAGGR